MNVVRTIFRIKPKESKKKKKNAMTFNNEFYIASNEFSKQKLISYYGIEDCAITSGLGSCVKLESIFGASIISRGSSSTLANSNTTLSSGNSLNKIKNEKKNSLKNLKGEEKLKKKDKKDKSKKSNNKRNKKDEIINEKDLEKEEEKEIENENENENENGKISSISELELNKNDSIKKSNTLRGYHNEAIDNVINEIKHKLTERNNKSSNNNNDNNDNDKSISNLKNDLTSSETIYKNSDSIDYLSDNPAVVIDINALKNEEKENARHNLPAYINKSKSNIQINNTNINNTEEELGEDSSKKEKITIDIDTPSKIATVTTSNNENDDDKDNKHKNEEEKEKERNIRYVNHLYTKKI
jgi:hypothetical protein